MLWGAKAKHNTGSRWLCLSELLSERVATWGASKQLSTDLQTKIIDYYEIGEVYKKLSGRFGLSVSTVRNVVQIWKATGTVLVQERCGRPEKKILERLGRRMDRMVTDKPQTNSRELQERLAAEGVVVHRSTIQLTLHQEKLKAQKAFPRVFATRESLEVSKSTSGQARSMFKINTVLR